MNQKHLLRFIKKKVKSCAEEKVLERNGKILTLEEVRRFIILLADSKNRYALAYIVPAGVLRSEPHNDL